jgi:hypothetical protein
MNKLETNIMRSFSLARKDISRLQERVDDLSKKHQELLALVLAMRNNNKKQLKKSRQQ